MLPAGSRLRHRADFSTTVRRSRGVRGDGLLVVHVRLAEAPETGERTGAGPASSRAGLVVSRAVGAAVTRNLVKRRLRHLLAVRLPAFPPGTQVVVRALPRSAHATYQDLGAALDRALDRALARAAAPTDGSAEGAR